MAFRAWSSSRGVDLSRGYINDLPTGWLAFWISLGLSIVLLVIAALLARVRIGSLPANPIYWHAWVITQSKPITYRGYPKKYHPFFLFWAASVFLLAFGLLLLVNIFLS